jgi:hypothetical protein
MMLSSSSLVSPIDAFRFTAGESFVLTGGERRDPVGVGDDRGDDF